MGSCMHLRNSTLIALSLDRIRFLIVLRPMTNDPHLRDRVQKWVNPKKSNVSGFPSPSLARCLAAWRPKRISRVLFGCNAKSNSRSLSCRSCRKAFASCSCSKPTIWSIRIEHPVHPLPQDADVESIQRIMLASSWPKPVGKPDEVLLVDRLQNRRNRLLESSIRLRDVCPTSGAGAVATLVDAIVQLHQFLFEVFSVVLPRHAIDARRGVPF